MCHKVIWWLGEKQKEWSDKEMIDSNFSSDIRDQLLTFDYNNKKSPMKNYLLELNSCKLEFANKYYFDVQ